MQWVLQTKEKLQSFGIEKQENRYIMLLYGKTEEQLQFVMTYQKKGNQLSFLKKQDCY